MRQRLQHFNPEPCSTQILYIITERDMSRQTHFTWPAYCRKEVQTVSWNAGSFQHIYFSRSHSRMTFLKWCGDDMFFFERVSATALVVLPAGNLYLFPVSASLSDSWPFRSYPRRERQTCSYGVPTFQWLHQWSNRQCSLSLESFENTEPSFSLVVVVQTSGLWTGTGVGGGAKRCLIQVSNPFFLGVYIQGTVKTKQSPPPDVVSHGTVHP